MERRNEIVRLKEAGASYAEIGRRWSISKQRVEQIVKDKPGKPTIDSKVMLTVSDVAYLLGIHINTVRRWSNNEILKAYRISSRGDRRFRREDIDRFLKEKEVG